MVSSGCSTDGDTLREHCGVIGIYAPGEDVARLAYFGLYALQHRGQESAGLATADGHRVAVHARMGLVAQVFDEDSLAQLGGHLAIGHTRYSTTGSSRVENAQPLVVESDLGPLALGHNGNLVNASQLRAELAAAGITPRTTTDSELIALACAAAQGPDWLTRVRQTMPRLSGAFCLVLLTRDRIIAVRDPLGIRPLCLGRLNGESGRVGEWANGRSTYSPTLPLSHSPTLPRWVVASESCALDTIGAEFIREIEPGEIVMLSADGVHSEHIPSSGKRALCTFEHIYFSRPDSIIDGRLVYAVRERMGRELAREYPADADLVMPVPDAATPAAIGYAAESGIPFREGLVKNRYIGRTFIQPQQNIRQDSVQLKFNPLPEVLAGKRIVLVDDSIVRGTTTPRVISILRRGGAREVHMRITAPPMAFPCYLGVDTAPIEQLIAANMTVPEICRHIGADSLGYLSIDGLNRAIGLPESTLCNACFHGRYPMPVELEADKLLLER